jgi:hypothetical protein
MFLEQTRDWCSARVWLSSVDAPKRRPILLATHGLRADLFVIDTKRF